MLGIKRGQLMGGLFGVATLLAAAPALANGQSTHLWITHDAVTHVPEGPLAAFLTRPELAKMFDNGTMFPDGGYPLGDDYAEIAHWEPFQISYLNWIMATYPAPLSDEGSEHLAFLLGMASHGMADQVFDSMYGERVKTYDGAFGEFDTASDLIMMSYFEPMMAPGDWVPYDVFDSLYDQAGYDVDPERMMSGQNLLRIAVNSVGIFSQMPDKVAEAAAPFPWGSAHLLDEDVNGAPPCEGEVVARYWRVLWALAHGQPLLGPVLASMPPDGGANHPIDMSSIESWVTIVTSRGLEDASLTEASFHVVAEGGESIPLVLWHYYGQDAHVVHLRPQQDLAADTVYTVTMDPGVQTIHGEALEGYEFRFSTGAQGPDLIVPEWPADHDPNPDPGDGDGDGDPGDGDPGDGDGDPGDGDGDPGDGDGDTGAGTDSSGGEAPAAGDAGGCGCVTRDPSDAPWPVFALAGLGLGAGLGRRRRGDQPSS
jgi:MYXO-CTERM domain-containing protein